MREGADATQAPVLAGQYMLDVLYKGTAVGSPMDVVVKPGPVKELVRRGVVASVVSAGEAVLSTELTVSAVDECASSRSSLALRRLTRVARHKNPVEACGDMEAVASVLDADGEPVPDGPVLVEPCRAVRRAPLLFVRSGSLTTTCLGV
jgi:hypothetical protein